MALSTSVETSIVVGTVLQILAIVLAFFRLYHRLAIRRFWWDDTWAAVALLCGINCVVCNLLTTFATDREALIAYWIYNFSFTGVIWAVRMSILFSITRLIHPSKTSRQIAFSVSALFVLLASGLVAWKIYNCAYDLSWEKVHFAGCPFPSPMAIYQLSTDVISDSILVALPLNMLWNIKLPQKRQRKMILSIFSTSIVISFISISRAVCRLLRLSYATYITGIVEITSCLYVCSLLVVVTYVDRVIRRDEGNDISDISASSNSVRTPDGPTTLFLTTVDLEHYGGNTTSISTDDENTCSGANGGKSSSNQRNVTSQRPNIVENGNNTTSASARPQALVHPPAIVPQAGRLPIVP